MSSVVGLAGSVALVTGASSGIDAATARALAAQGAAVALVARRADRLARLADELVRSGAVALAIEADITDRVAAFAAVDEAVQELGRLDVLVNNAGVMLLGPMLGALVEEWERMLDVAGRTVRSGSGVYNATKHGVGALSESLRQEVTSRHVRVSLIEPGAVDTELVGHNRPEIQTALAGRFGDIDQRGTPSCRTWRGCGGVPGWYV